MRRWFGLAFCLLAIGSLCLVQGKAQRLPNLGAGGPTISGGVPSCTEATNFLAAITAQSTNYQNAYKTLICNLVTDGTFSSKYDCIFAFKAHEVATALTSLTLSSNCTAVNTSVTFTADVGFTGTGVSGNHIVSGFNPGTATSPIYVQNSAHISINIVSNRAAAIYGDMNTTAVSPVIGIYPFYVDNNSYLRINDTTPGESAGVSVGASNGFWLVTRSSSSVAAAYRNGSVLASYSPVTSATVPNSQIRYLDDIGGTSPSTDQINFSTIGGSLSSTDVSNLNSRMTTYLGSVP